MNPENTEVPLLATPEAENAAADAAAAGILGDDSLLGPALEGEALEDEIRRQVEYFLSREYLSTDPYLVSQMNSDMYFPITTVATLTTFKVDLEVLVKTLRKSTLLSVNDNGTMVKPSFKIQRNTLILRDIPSSTKVEEVQGIFQGEGCPTTTGIRPDIGDCWFVTFNSEEDALSALDFVRGRTFHDAPVKARIKSENLLRSLSWHEDGRPICGLQLLPSVWRPAHARRRPSGTAANARRRWRRSQTAWRWHRRTQEGLSRR
jgi:la-related protein 4